MNVSDVHFTITVGGLSGVVASMLLCAYRIGRILEALESHVEQCNQIHALLVNQRTGPRHRKQ